MRPSAREFHTWSSQGSFPSGATNSTVFSQPWCMMLHTEYGQPGKVIWALVSRAFLQAHYIDIVDCLHGWCFVFLQKSKLSPEIKLIWYDLRPPSYCFTIQCTPRPQDKKNTFTRQDIARPQRSPPRSREPRPDLSLGKINPLLHKALWGQARCGLIGQHSPIFSFQSYHFATNPRGLTRIACPGSGQKYSYNQGFIRLHSGPLPCC